MYIKYSYIKLYGIHKWKSGYTIMMCMHVSEYNNISICAIYSIEYLQYNLCITHTAKEYEHGRIYPTFLCTQICEHIIIYNQILYIFRFAFIFFTMCWSWFECSVIEQNVAYLYDYEKVQRFVKSLWQYLSATASCYRGLDNAQCVHNERWEMYFFPILCATLDARRLRLWEWEK